MRIRAYQYAVWTDSNIFAGSCGRQVSGRQAGVLRAACRSRHPHTYLYLARCSVFAKFLDAQLSGGFHRCYLILLQLDLIFR